MDGLKIIEIKDKIIQHFGQKEWLEVGLITGCSKQVKGHSRLLKSLSWNDNDYHANILDVLYEISKADIKNIEKIHLYIENKFGNINQKYISYLHSEKKIVFAPNVFKLPDSQQNDNLVGVMMPFSTEFDAVFEAIKQSCDSYEVKRADEIWEDSAIIQDVFSIIFTSKCVIADLTESNPNVYYEVGIAHTLGKVVIPISQNTDNFPFDLRHHRCLKYVNNEQGRTELTKKLKEKVKGIMG